jgi:hypothetical protein
MNTTMFGRERTYGDEVGFLKSQHHSNGIRELAKAEHTVWKNGYDRRNVWREKMYSRAIQELDLSVQRNKLYEENKDRFSAEEKIEYTSEYMMYVFDYNRYQEYLKTSLNINKFIIDYCRYHDLMSLDKFATLKLLMKNFLTRTLIPTSDFQFTTLTSLPPNWDKAFPKPIECEPDIRYGFDGSIDSITYWVW